MSCESLLGVACVLLFGVFGVFGVIGVLWGIMGYHIAQVNVARALDALNSDVMAGFVACLTSIREVVQQHLRLVVYNFLRHLWQIFVKVNCVFQSNQGILTVGMSLLDMGVKHCFECVVDR